MTIVPQPNIVYLKLQESSAGILDTSSRSTAVECAEVIAAGDGVTLNSGDKVFVKAWAIDIVTHEDMAYHFVNVQSGGLLATIHD